MSTNQPGTLPDGKKLNLGCGPVQPAGWVNVDGSNRAFLASKLNWLDTLMVKAGLFPPTEFSSATTYLNLFKPLPFADDSVACVYAGELWEHFEYADAMKLTRECFRVLKPKGVLRVCVPDGPAFWQNYLELYRDELAKPPAGRDAKRLVSQIGLYFGDICTRRIFLGSMGHVHKWQFDEVQLVDMFSASGFTTAERRRFHDSRIPDVDRVERSNFLIVEGIKPG